MLHVTLSDISDAKIQLRSYLGSQHGTAIRAQSSRYMYKLTNVHHQVCANQRKKQPCTNRRNVSHFPLLPCIDRQLSNEPSIKMIFHQILFFLSNQSQINGQLYKSLIFQHNLEEAAWFLDGQAAPRQKNSKMHCLRARGHLLLQTLLSQNTQHYPENYFSRKRSPFFFVFHFFLDSLRRTNRRNTLCDPGVDFPE